MDRATPVSTEAISALERPRPALKRSVGLLLAVLYGLGVTIGAGIYVLIGAAAGRAGNYAPMAFLVAGGIMGLTACTFAELVGRMPVSAGEAAYVRAGFGSERIALVVGLLVIAAAIVAAAAITNGSVGYIHVFLDVRPNALAMLVLLTMGGIAAFGMLTSAWIAGLMTVIEIGGLVAIIVAGVGAKPVILLDIGAAVPSLRDAAAWSGVLAAIMLAFFAFIGFEGLVNIAEEVREPEKTLPRAIVLTLAISTLLYIHLVWVALTAVPRAELAASQAPLSLVFQRVTGAPPHVVTAIAIIATLNGVIAQIVLAARVMYGLAETHDLPAIFGAIDRRTQTPLLATAIATGLSIILATQFSIDRLAHGTSLIMLTIFCVVNLALVRIKLRGDVAPPGVFQTPIWVPIAGAITCAAALLSTLLR